MKVKITLKDLFDLPGSEIVNPDSYKGVNKVSIDSRQIEKGSLFIAIKGEKFDGHEFIRDVIKKGASAVVIERKKYPEFDDVEVPLVIVNDTTIALGWLAKAWRSKLKAKVISLTGCAEKKDFVIRDFSKKKRDFIYK